MISNYMGTIFKIPFPFTDLSGSKARPALALAEPDQYGDISLAFVTTKKTRLFLNVKTNKIGALPVSETQTN